MTEIFNLEECRTTHDVETDLVRNIMLQEDVYHIHDDGSIELKMKVCASLILQFLV